MLWPAVCTLGASACATSFERQESNSIVIDVFDLGQALVTSLQAFAEESNLARGDSARC